MKDGLRPLPDDIVAPLLRALVTLRPTPENRLYLQRSEYGRAPGWDAETDYNVIYRGRPVGRIWRHIYERHAFQNCPWHWTVRPSNDDWQEDWGHAMTLQEAMEQFRMSWDAYRTKQGFKRERG
jgi:hypothetical protein